MGVRQFFASGNSVNPKNVFDLVNFSSFKGSRKKLFFLVVGAGSLKKITFFEAHKKKTTKQGTKKLLFCGFPKYFDTVFLKLNIRL